MGFQEQADSIRSRLHLGRTSRAAVAGVALAAVAVCVLIVVLVIKPGSGGEVLTRADDASSAAEAQNGSASTSFAEQETALVCVHVSGCVTSPGLCYLDEGSRVADAVEAAGGFADDAQPDALNLARVLVDGEQIVVPSKEEAASVPAGSNGTAAGVVSGKVNINTADAEQLETLDGVGEATAEKIIASREEDGPFASPEDIMRVSGIGEKKYEAMKDDICV